MMVAPTLQAHSASEIVRLSVRALIRRFHLNRDWIIGLIGDRGSGKSLGGGNITIRDFMMNGEPAWSNMKIRLNVNVTDELAQRYGTKGELLTYQADHIDKQAFLALDSRYEGGCLFFDEFNLEYGESRRSIANVNLMTDRAIQQLRKIQCGLVYTVLNEMYVDSRIRENTDVFIKCADVALNAGNLQNKMKQGVVFEWLIFPMSSKLVGNGRTYKDTHRPIGPIQITMGNIWGTIDTYEMQAQGRTSYSDKKVLAPLDIGEDTKVITDRDKWGWIDERLDKFFKAHAEDGDLIEISSNDFREELGVPKPLWGVVTSKLYDKLPDMESRGGQGVRNPKKFFIRNKILD